MKTNNKETYRLRLDLSGRAKSLAHLVAVQEP